MVVQVVKALRASRQLCRRSTGSASITLPTVSSVANVVSSNTHDSYQRRTHMNHGGGMPDAPPSQAGPRSGAVQLGLASAQHSSNILRLLESSHGATSHYNTAMDTLSTVWHPESLCWRYPEDQKEWQAVSPLQQAAANDTTTTQEQPSMNYYGALAPPKLLSTLFSDDRTALVKLQGSDGRLRYVSLLRLDPPDPTDGQHHQHHHHNQASNDGWTIVREVLVPEFNSSSENATDSTGNDDIWTSLQSTLHAYLEIEHGGGPEDFVSARTLFHPQSSLLTVGISEPDDTDTSAWTAPAGRLLEISRTTYLGGVKTQSPHAPAARQFDQICTMDIISGSSPTNNHTNAPAAAVATVRVGNGAQTMVFEDHLLLGYNSGSGSWNILSKIFSPQAWPK